MSQPIVAYQITGAHGLIYFYSNKEEAIKHATRSELAMITLTETARETFHPQPIKFWAVNAPPRQGAGYQWTFATKAEADTFAANNGGTVFECTRL